MSEDEKPSTNKKKLAWGGGAAAAITAAATLISSVYSPHTQSTAISRNDTPIVVNRPTDANGSPRPVTVITQKAGPPIVIVGSGAPPLPCETPSPTPTSTPTPKPTPTPSPTPSC